MRIRRCWVVGQSAIWAVHTFGHPAPMQSIREIADRHRLSVIEDAAEALGGTLAGRALGSFGEAGVYAFYPNKQMTTGEGGAVVTDDDDLARRVRMLRNQGRDPEANRYVDLGYSYRLPDILCALGKVQLERLDEFLARRAKVARTYDERLRGDDRLTLPPPPPAGAEMSWFVYVVRLAERFTAADRDAVAQALMDRGIGAGRYFPPIHLQPFYRERFGFGPGDFPVAEAVAGRTLALPFYNALREPQIDHVCETLRKLLDRR